MVSVKTNKELICDRFKLNESEWNKLCLSPTKFDKYDAQKIVCLANWLQERYMLSEVELKNLVLTHGVIFKLSPETIINKEKFFIKTFGFLLKDNFKELFKKSLKMF